MAHESGPSEPAKVYTVSGGRAGAGNSGATSNSTSLPDLLRRSGSNNKRRKRPVDDEIARIELIQDFEFPEASNKLRSTRDGQHLVATGTYKPQMRVWDLEQLSLKFERHTDAENVDFVLLSDDWTKSLHLQADRSLEMHSQGGTHTRVRIPRFGRALGYHFPTCDALVGAAGREIFRLNLDQGRFLAPYVLGGGDERGEVEGCNAVDVNPAHGLLAFGTEGSAGTVELWDPRARTRAGKLSIATRAVVDAALSSARRGLPALSLPQDESGAGAAGLSVTCLASADDGLNLAVGTGTGHVLLYDLRADRPYVTKDQGYGLPIRSLAWTGNAAPSISGGGGGAARGRSEAEGKVMSADSKVIKVWDKDTADNLLTVTPSSSDLNDVHNMPGTGLLLGAVEGVQMSAWYVPALGPAPRWCSFLDSITDELDEVGAPGSKGVYEDFKFVERGELERLGMSHLIGTSLLKPYMHGYFVALGLYDKARLLANPTAYADARERAIRARIDKAADSRIRARKHAPAAPNVRVNKDLAERMTKQSEREEKKRENKAAAAAAGEEGADAEAAAAKKNAGVANLLTDARFKELFTNPEFQVDDTSREFAMLNPSTAAKGPRKRTAVEAEEEESDRESLDPDQEEESGSEDDDGAASDDSSDAGDLSQYNPRERAQAEWKQAGQHGGPKYQRGDRPRLVEDDDDDGAPTQHAGRGSGRRSAPFEERLRRGAGPGRGRTSTTSDGLAHEFAGERSVSWVPSSSGGASSRSSGGGGRGCDDSGSRGGRGGKAGGPKAKGGESFGMGMSKAGGEEGRGVEGLSEDARFGRTKRRNIGRSASKNAMRK